jgi:hypothetical protein
MSVTREFQRAPSASPTSQISIAPAPPPGPVARPDHGPQVTLPFTDLERPVGVAVNAVGDLDLASPLRQQLTALLAIGC